MLLASGFIYSDSSAQNTPSKKDKETADKIIGVWNIKDIDEGRKVPKNLQKQTEKELENMLKDAYMYFKQDGTCEFHVSTDDIDETWKLSADGKKLIIMDNKNSYHADSFLLINLTKTKVALGEAGHDKFRIYLEKQGNALTDEQQKKHVELMNLKLKKKEEYLKQAYADSAAAVLAYDKQQHDDSVAREGVDFSPCYYLKLICKPFDYNSSNLKNELNSKDSLFAYYKSPIMLPDSKGAYYRFENSADRPRRFSNLFEEDLSEKEALALYNKVLATYKQCKTDTWSESIHKDDKGRWSYTEISGADYGGAKELSIEMNYNADRRNYSVELNIEEE